MTVAYHKQRFHIQKMSVTYIPEDLCATKNQRTLEKLKDPSSMGCVSSKLAKEDFKQEILMGKSDYSNHIVSLTSSTYGVLKLDQDSIRESRRSPPPPFLLPKSQRNSLDEPEIINAWELMEDLDDGKSCLSPPKITTQNGSKLLTHMKSPRKQKRFVEKENKYRMGEFDSGGRLGCSPKKPLSSLENIPHVAVPDSRIQSKTPLGNLKIHGYESRFSTSTRSLSPLFDPELLASLEREHTEQIKKLVSPKTRSKRPQNADSMLESFEKKCPPGGENSVLLYTTTLRGIRKTFEDCNSVRSIIESHNVRMIERDISMDSGFREELRVLMGQKGVRVPMAFVKGRLIGGVDTVLRLEEEGKLGVLFEGIPRAAGWCEGCGGVRFIMCMDCSGSCKVLDEKQKKLVKCGECNENGLIQCPICC